ncbi:MAG: hypothetical protein KAU21_11670 [Gammaproteobacteria bacterium]|nr:hypothetical protein [Gammaproteobacteria bacterium]
MLKKEKNISAGNKGSLEHLPVFSYRFLLPKHWLVWLGVFVLWLLSFTPHKFKNSLASIIVFFSCKTSSKRYRIAKKNLVMCFPEKASEDIAVMVRKSFYFKARVFLDYAFLWFSTEEKLRKLYLIKHDGEFRGLKTLDKNIIILTCHMLALDQAAQALALDNQMVTMYKEIKNPVMDWLVARGRARFNMHLYERAYGMMGIVSSTKAGEPFFYLPDEDLGDSQSEFLPFFGVQKSTITALGRLAKICDAKVLPCIPIFNEKTGVYEIHFLPSMSNYPTGDKIADALTMNQMLEKMILKAPEQYIWTFRYFKTRPGEESSVY